MHGIWPLFLPYLDEGKLTMSFKIFTAYNLLIFAFFIACELLTFLNEEIGILKFTGFSYVAGK